MPIAFAFFDYNGISVEILEVITPLQEQSVEPVNISVLQRIYSLAKTLIRLHKDSSIKKGVLQRDTRFPRLFTAHLERVFRRLNWYNKGINFDGEYLADLKILSEIIEVSSTPNEQKEN